MKFLFLTIIIFLTFETNSFAYLDPGSGSILLQAILFVLASIGTFFAFFKTKLNELLSKIFKKKKLNEENKNDETK
tara:strand:+ start:3670 stop:3897 length:228 start_codon:yes stop_codon:yes gene_type:complete